MRVLPHKKIIGAIYNTPNIGTSNIPPLNGIPKITQPTPHDHTADTITLDNWKKAISTVIKRTVKKIP